MLSGVINNLKYRNMKTGILKIGFTLYMLFLGSIVFGQINEGKIIFERKTNLEKKFNDARMKRMIGENNKIRIEKFTLFFNDTCSIFKPILTDEADPLSWTTTRNTIYHNVKTEQKISELNLMGQMVYINDTNQKREWKITDSKRMIAGYDCYKAIWQKDDSTRIYAWFSIDIVPSVGPEGFNGLPGAILGLATEDGGIIYFAKSVELTTPKSDIFIIDLRKKDVYTLKALKEKVDKEVSGNPMGKRMAADIFRWL